MSCLLITSKGHKLILVLSKSSLCLKKKQFDTRIVQLILYNYNFYKPKVFFFIIIYKRKHFMIPIKISFRKCIQCFFDPLMNYARDKCNLKIEISMKINYRYELKTLN